MAQYTTESLDKRSNFPTNSHAGMVMSHRSAVTFKVAAALAVNDVLVFGQLADAYVLNGLVVDSDAIANLVADVLLVDSLDNPTFTLELAKGVTFANAEAKEAPLSLAAARFKGENRHLYIIAKVKTAGNVTAGQQIGLRLDYRYRQNTN
ncbi:hypothetical protein NQ651_17405 [Acinetobacter baumannii]|nr:hypothetical protein [Acinetobacter baumannii]